MSIQRATLMCLMAGLALILSGSIYSAEPTDTSDSSGQAPATPAKTSDSAVAQDNPEKDSPNKSLHKVVAYYFHTTRRCYSCKKIEELTKQAIDSGFAKELAEGQLEFHSINIDMPENKHYIQDYQLYTKTLIVSDVVDSKQLNWKNLTNIWRLRSNQQGFFKYVQDEIRAYLKGS